MNESAKKEIDWAQCVLYLREHGQEYRYGSGNSWDYKSEYFPIVEGAEYTWANTKLRIDKIDDEKQEIYFTYFSSLKEKTGYSNKLHASYEKYVLLKSYSNSGGANDFFWVDSNNLKLCFAKKDEIK